MDNFEKFKDLWQQPLSTPDLAEAQRQKQSHLVQPRKLEQKQLWGASTLFITAVLLIALGFWGPFIFRSQLTYVAIGLLALTSAGQGVVSLYIYYRLRQIDPTASVTQHLQQWEQYYAFRQRINRINWPVYYLLLNGAFGLYFIEVLGMMAMTSRLIALGLYVAWVLLAYFVLGKRAIRRENERLTAIIATLGQQQQQLTDTD